MARSRKSRSGGVVVALVIVGLALLAAIPNEVLIGIALPAAIATVICFYFFSQYKKAKSAVNKPESQRQTPQRAVRVSRKPAKGLTRTSRRTIAEDTLVSAGNTACAQVTHYETSHINHVSVAQVLGKD